MSQQKRSGSGSCALAEISRLKERESNMRKYLESLISKRKMLEQMANDSPRSIVDRAYRRICDVLDEEEVAIYRNGDLVYLSCERDGVSASTLAFELSDNLEKEDEDITK